MQSINKVVRYKNLEKPKKTVDSNPFGRPSQKKETAIHICCYYLNFIIYFNNAMYVSSPRS